MPIWLIILIIVFVLIVIALYGLCRAAAKSAGGFLAWLDEKDGNHKKS